MTAPGSKTSAREPAPSDDCIGNHDETHYSRPKRRRTALACDSCRLRKSRCDGARPICYVCVGMGFECVYRRPATSTNCQIKDSSYEEQLEEKLERMESRMNAFMARTREVLDTRIMQGGFHSSEIESSAGTAAASGGIRSGQSVGPLTPSNDEDTVDGMGAITFADEQTSGFFGPSSNTAFFRHIVNAMGTVMSAEVQNLPHIASWNASARTISRPASPSQHSIEPLSAIGTDECVLPPESEVFRLIDLYFSNTGMLFPYLHKESIVETYHEMKSSQFRNVRRSWLCILNVIMAFATCVSENLLESIVIRTTAAEVFFRRALALSRDITYVPANLERLQALLLITQYLQGTQRSAQTWSLHGITVQAALQIGVQSKELSSIFSPVEQEMRNRCWHMCVTLDRMISMTLGRCPAIPPDYIQIQPPLEIDLEELRASTSTPSIASESSTVALFCASVKLYGILGEIIRIIYGNNLNATIKSTTSFFLCETIKLENQLADWKHGLPPNLRVESLAEISSDMGDFLPVRRLQKIITMRYLNTRILLHRQIIVCFLDYVAKGFDTSPQDAVTWQLLDTFGQSSLNIATESASTLIAIIHCLIRRPNLFPAWWFVVYYTFNASLVCFGALLVQSRLPLRAPVCSLDSLAQSLDLALEALSGLGGEIRLVRRCTKVLQKLILASAPLKTQVFSRDMQGGDDLQIQGKEHQSQNTETWVSGIGMATGGGNDEIVPQFWTGSVDSWFDSNLTQMLAGNLI